jgi:putative ABC transport system permease protein
VLSEQTARKYFGDVPPGKIIGRELVYNDSVHTTVSGIVRDWVHHTDFPFTEFISLSTANHGFLQQSLQLDQHEWKGVPFSSRLLIKLHDHANPAVVNASLQQLYKNNWQQGIGSITLQPLSSVHFSKFGSATETQTTHLPTLYILAGVALFILFLAIINYVNLSTAQSFSYEKSTGIRKMLGSSRTGLVMQFLLETFLLTLFAAAIAVLLVQPVLTIFRDFIPPGLRFSLAAAEPLFFLVGVAVITSLLAGLYPARLLSSGLPIQVLKGSGSFKGNEKWWLRKGLIVFQFSISLVFIIGTLVVGRQIYFMLNKDPGFRSDAVVLVGNSDDREHIGRVKLVTETIRQLPGVAAVARENIPPMAEEGGSFFTIQYGASSNKGIQVGAIKADEHFIPLYGIRLLSGRNLLPSDTIKEVVINETLSKLLGFKNPEQALGQSIFTWNKYCPIVGVVGDFHQASFRTSIRPMLIAGMACTDIVVKLRTGNKSADETKIILGSVEAQWKKFYPHTSFEYNFLDKSLAQMYKQEQTIAWLMNIATGITIFISCIGLFGLTLFTTEKRTKEIGIRKILGAGITDIVALLSRDFVVLVIIGMAIASPVAWWVMRHWLQDFAYRIPLSIDIFLTAGLALLLITLLTTAFQSIKAALANPVKSLRTE